MIKHESDNGGKAYSRGLLQTIDNTYLKKIVPTENEKMDHFPFINICEVHLFPIILFFYRGNKTNSIIYDQV